MQLWQSERYDWANLKGAGKAPTGVPLALEMLRTAASEKDADDAYWQIDNTVVVQGALYESALPTAACIVTMLATCTPVSRIRVLELLDQISGATAEPGQERLVAQINDEVIRGFGVYAGLLQHGTDMERELCVELALSCAQGERILRDRVRFYLQRLSSDSETSQRVRDYAMKRLNEAETEW